MPISPILPKKLVAMERPLSDRKMNERLFEHFNTSTNPENLLEFTVVWLTDCFVLTWRNNDNVSCVQTLLRVRTNRHGRIGQFALCGVFTALAPYMLLS